MSAVSLVVRRRSSLALLVGALVLAMLTALTFSGPADADRGKGSTKAGAKAKKTADKTYSGYPIRSTGHADGDYLGARRIGGAVVYRIDPQARSPRSKGFGVPAYTTVLTGSGKKTVTQRDTEQAAYILGRFGSLKLKVQNAAVELALDELLVGGKYSLKGSRTKARLAQLGKSRQKKIISFTKQLLAGAAEFGSAYTVTLTSTPSVALGQPVTATIAVSSSATGAGIANLPVVFTYPGAAPQPEVRTNASGAASATFTATGAGPQTITANIGNIPETRLIVITPTNKSASRVVIADLKNSGSITASTAVRAAPTLTMPATYPAIPTGTATSAKATLGATYPTSRSATAVLYGPFATAAAANASTCTTTAFRSGRIAMKANGAYLVPALKPTKAGFYKWGVSVPADAYNDAASVCAGRVQATAPTA